MSEIVLQIRALTDVQPRKTLAAAVKLWFVVAAAGHWLFLAYILGVFFPPIAQDGFEGLKNLHLPSGFREGDTLGNLAATSHVLLAAIIIGGGPLQLVAAIRSRYPVFHRWLGRSYLLAAVTTSIGGFYMVWTRGTVGNVITDLGISLDAILVVICAFMAVRYAMARRFREHRRWAMRLFMVASAVWFFRVGLMGWVVLTGGIGIDFETFTGPFLYVIGFAQYLLPLAVLEWYFRCEDKASPAGQVLFAGTLFGLTMYMTVGIFAATMGMWLPRM